MAVACEFIDVIVPIANIDRVYPGGFEAFRRDRGGIQGATWFDEHLLREGAMSPMDVEGIVAYWQSLGLEATVERNGTVEWQDLCIVEILFGGPTLPCDWLAYDGTQRCAFLKGYPPGDVIGYLR